jgi:hypothetical protein
VIDSDRRKGKLKGPQGKKSASRSEWRRRAAALSLSGFCLSFGSPEPLDRPAPFGRANPGMPTSTRQQSEAEERVATSAALSAAEEQVAQAAAAEQSAQEALSGEPRC